MARRRFFVPEVRNKSAEIQGEDARHLTQVLRVEVGQKYEISDNQDVYLAEVEIARKQLVGFKVLEQLPAEQVLVPVDLYLALIKFERLELLLEKATELGVASFHLVQAERSERGLERAAPKRMQRWRRIVLEASQQSRRRRMPQLYDPVQLKDALDVEAGYKLFLDERRDGHTVLDAVQKPSHTAVLVGPEGGWPDHERESLIAAGWTPISLGPLVLRSETAGIAALSLLNGVFYGSQGLQ